MTVNSEGVPLGVNGFVVCYTCGKEVQEVSRETTKEYARCLSHYQRAQSPTGEGMSKKKVRSEGTHKIPAPISFLKELLSEAPITRDQLKAKMVKKEYAPGTINTQLFNLRHWAGCLVQEDGFVKNPSYMEQERQKKTPKPTTLNSARQAKKKAAKAFHPAPKPGQKVANG